MLNAEQCFLDCINSTVRNVKARVELYNGSALVDTFKHTDRLTEFDIERVGKGNFFGYGICQKLKLKLIDSNRELELTTANTLDVAFGTDCEYIYPFPLFKITEVNRDEETNELSITAYDALYFASYHTVAELGLVAPYTIRDFATACAALLGTPIGATALEAFDTEYVEGANFEGTESLREALDDIAEATQTIYFVNHDWQLIFKRLDITGDAVLTIDKEKYFELDSSTNRRLAAVCHATELGDNVSASLDVSGSTAYVRNNAFWDLRTDIDTLVESALATVANLTINQFECEWRGNYLVEIGDKIALITKDNDTVFSYLLNDIISYDGALVQKSEWQYEDDEAANESNPSNLGDVLRQTFARVDKANKQIDLVVSDVSNNTEAIANLRLTADSVAISVESVKQEAQNNIDSLNDNLTDLANKVEAKMSAEDVRLEISNTIANGVEKVTTTTGFTFDENGLLVSKSGSEMRTQITEDGMRVYRDDEAVLTANNVGVDAVNLHATTYLIIGENSRFEDWDNRTGCFWIGGN